MPPTQLAYPSPKRKRDQPPPVPLLNTTLRTASTPPPRSPAPSPRPESPRNVVADQMRSMSLTATSAIPVSPLSPNDDKIHKKPKLDGTEEYHRTYLDTPVLHAKSEHRKNHLDKIAVLKLDPASEIPETPQSQPRILTDIASFAEPTAFLSSATQIATHYAPPATLTNHNTRVQNRSSSIPRQRNKSPSPSALTWQVSEITGHLADPSIDPDDDGTGLNGIGFRPTPAIAYARSQKRRQQLNEWKARETREARAKRHERRRRGVGGRTSRDATVEREMPVKELEVQKRVVKFAV